MSTEPQQTCSSCGNEFSGAMEFCPACLLRRAVDSDGASAVPFSEHAAKLPSQQVSYRFEHYELAKGEDGKPVELGRGAMGVTYKAFDVDLRCPVTLKVIRACYLKDESARLRFLRESTSRGQRATSQRSLGVSPRQKRRGLLLRDGVCRG
jgi:hypothetical protein